MNIPESVKITKQDLILKQQNPVARYINEKIEIYDHLGSTVVQIKWSTQWLYRYSFLPFLIEKGLMEDITFNKFGRDFFEIMSGFPAIERHKGGSYSVYYTGFDVIDCPIDTTFTQRQANFELEKRNKELNISTKSTKEVFIETLPSIIEKIPQVFNTIVNTIEYLKPKNEIDNSNNGKES